MNWSDLPRQPSHRTLRQFAVLWMAFFLFLACRHGLLLGQPGVGAAAALLALAVGPVGLVRPRSLRLLFVGWTVLAFPVGWLVSRLVLTLVFYGLFTPVALFFRRTGRDLLALRTPAERDTYWEPKPQPSGPRSYLRQF